MKAAAILAAALALALAVAGPSGAAAAAGLTAADQEPEPAMIQSPMKSNGSGVALAYRVVATPAIGVPVTVRLRFSGVSDPAGATVRFTTDGGLSLADGTDPALALAAGQDTLTTVRVVPGQAGIGYLHVFTTQRGTTSATSVPVQVGKAPASLHAPLGQARQLPGGEKIVPMPVK